MLNGIYLQVTEPFCTGGKALRAKEYNIVCKEQHGF